VSAGRKPQCAAGMSVSCGRSEPGQFDDAFRTLCVLESIAWPVSFASFAIPFTVFAQDDSVISTSIAMASETLSMAKSPVGENVDSI
jgi:hypothetical protein